MKRAVSTKIGIAEKVSAKDSLARFVDEAREMQPYPDVSWERVEWDITSGDSTQRAHLANKITLIFAEHAIKKVSNDLRIPFMGPFGDAVKACIVRKRIKSGVGSGPQRVFVRAARYLYAELPLPVRNDPTQINLGHFLAAENAITAREKPSSAYRAATHLEELSRILDRHGVCRIAIGYRAQIKRPTAHVDRTSATFEQRVKELPEAVVLDALATISNDPEALENPFDLLRARITEILLVCGFRIGEALTLPADTLVRERVLDEAGNVRLDALTGNPIERLGLRYWPEKGGDPVVKWILTIANPLILRALADIDRVCKAARENATWLAAHPGDVNLDCAPNERVSLSDASEMLGIVPSSFRNWLNTGKRGGQQLVIDNDGHPYILGADLRSSIASDRYNKPVLVRENGKRQLLGESLIVIFLHESTIARGTNRFISMPLIWGQMRGFLCGYGNLPSIFERRNFLADDGRPFRIRTHDFRRLENVIAQRGGLTQIEIAQWMGRRRISDNAAYDLRTPTEMAVEMRELIAKNEVYGIIAEQVRALPEVERSSFLQNRLAMSHTTPLGNCASNIAENPCATAMSCLGGCRQYLRQKGDVKSRESLRRIERETLVALKNSREAMALGKFNAENWVRAQETILKTVRAALAIDDDALTIEGEIVRVNPDGPLIGKSL